MNLRLIVLFPILILALQISAEVDHNSSLLFIENNGQWNSSIKYKAKIGGGNVYLEQNSFTYSVINREDLHEVHELSHDDKSVANNYPIHGHVFQLNFLNSKSANITKERESSSYFNFFKGQKSKWASNVKGYEVINYTALYEGVDLKVYSQAGNFKYDFVVQPNADPTKIKFKYEGLESLNIDEKGQLALQTSIGTYYEQKPYAYQVINGEEIEVPCLFNLSNSEISFELPSGYDEDIALIIDPTLVGATLSGTSSLGQNYGHTSTFDLQGNIYTGARSFGPGYPTTTGAFQTTFAADVDIAISKLDPTASNLIYATYLGGSSSDLPHSMFVENGELHVLATSTSADFPVTAAAFQNSLAGGGGWFASNDIVISHFNTSGTALIGSTYIGGTADDGPNQIYSK